MAEKDQKKKNERGASIEIIDLENPKCSASFGPPIDLTITDDDNDDEIMEIKSFNPINKNPILGIKIIEIGDSSGSEMKKKAEEESFEGGPCVKNYKSHLRPETEKKIIRSCSRSKNSGHEISGCQEGLVGSDPRKKRTRSEMDAETQTASSIYYGKSSSILGRSRCRPRTTVRHKSRRASADDFWAPRSRGRPKTSSGRKSCRSYADYSCAPTSIGLPRCRPRTTVRRKLRQAFADDFWAPRSRGRPKTSSRRKSCRAYADYSCAPRSIGRGGRRGRATGFQTSRSVRTHQVKSERVKRIKN